MPTKVGIHAFAATASLAATTTKSKLQPLVSAPKPGVALRQLFGDGQCGLGVHAGQDRTRRSGIQMLENCGRTSPHPSCRALPPPAPASCSKTDPTSRVRSASAAENPCAARASTSCRRRSSSPICRRKLVRPPQPAPPVSAGRAHGGPAPPAAARLPAIACRSTTGALSDGAAEPEDPAARRGLWSRLGGGVCDWGTGHAIAGTGRRPARAATAPGQPLPTAANSPASAV